MKGKKQVVQARLLEKNPRAVFVPCGAHTLNLVLADATKSSRDAVGFFGHLQKVYTFFSGGTQRWSILRSHVDLTVKSWSDTRRESRLQSVHAVRYQAAQIRDALLEARQSLSEPIAKVEAQALAEEVGSYRFLICCIVWNDILTTGNQVNKLLLSASMQLDVAIDLIATAKTSLTQYRASGFAAAQTTAKDLCEEMNIEAVLVQKRLRNTKRQFTYEATDEPLADACLEVTFFNVVVDAALNSLEERFDTMQNVKDNFGVLLNFNNVTTMSRDTLKNQCADLEKMLSKTGESDICGAEMAEEILNLPSVPPKITVMQLLEILHEKQIQELYPNLSFFESFSKLKLVKTHLCSTMGQERLSGLALISINRELSQQISYEAIIDDFASKKSRRVHLK
ncbi:hypothetical protein NHX12_017924 [Muraenolepis orangiensis]|uniref:Zinc finger MYM-type 1-like protein n=1 Tax=Muraenolepis orangiensis TaxID=630683 RepID=A0A9Q0IXK3_9TELE|nr:hypothetical protein NHX12_017924 [Muraenolepis orangiensis]